MRITKIRTAIFLFLAMAVLMGIAPKGHDGQSIEAAVLPDVSSVKSGDWSDSSVWDNNTVPQQGNAVQINFGHTVTYDVSSDAVLGMVSIEGTLYFSRTANTRLKTNDNIMVMSGGYLDMGTASDFIPQNVKAEVIFVLPQGYTYTGGAEMDLRDKGIWAVAGSRWEVHGAPLLRTWSKLAGDAPAGASTVVVENDVTDWQVGGKVVLSSTRVPKEYYIRDDLRELATDLPPEEEMRTIIGIAPDSSGGTGLTLDRPLNYFHSGTAPMRGEVGYLTRNVLFRTELEGYSIPEDVLSVASSAYEQRGFAHTMFMRGSKGNVQYAEFKSMGNFNTVARYPIHLHEMKETAIGFKIRGNSVWLSGMRGITAHDTEGILVEDNVTFDIFDMAYFLEATPAQDRSVGFPKNNVFVHNLGVRAVSFRTVNPGHLGMFWLDTLDNHFLGNVATGMAGSSESSGFATEAISNSTGVQFPWTMVKNEMHSNNNYGIRTWNNDVPVFDFVDNLIWRNGVAGIRWGAYGSPFRYHHTQLLENAQGGTHVLSIQGYFQDSVIQGGANENFSTERGLSIDGYVANPFPDTPIKLIRTTFEGHNQAELEQNHNACTEPVVPGEDKYISIRDGSCLPAYIESIGSSYLSLDALEFGWQRNKNSFWVFYDYQGPQDLPKDFVILRKDQQDSASQTDLTKRLITTSTFYSNEIDALVTPLSSLPGDIEYKDLLWYDNVTDRTLTYDFTFKKEADYPPMVGLNADLSGTEATYDPTVTDDNSVSKVEFWLDENKIAEKTAAPFTHTVDLAMSGRKYAYLYVKAFDDQGQYAYSKVTEIGPEVLLTEGNRLNQPPKVVASGDTQVSLTAAATLTATVTDDGLPDPPSAVTTTWSKVSGPTAGAIVTFGTPAALTTTATFSELGVYVLELSADDTLLIGSDQVSVTVLTPSVLTSITVDPAAATTMPGGLVQFTALGLDQHGNSFPINPTWEVSDGGSIDQFGMFTAGSAEGGPFAVTAAEGSISGTATVSVVTQLVVSDLNVASGQAYQMGDSLTVSDPVYIDRIYAYTGVPDMIQGEPYFKTANVDKTRTETSFLTFSVNQDVTVFVAYDSRASSLPSWLSGWTDIGQALVTSDGPLALYSQEFTAGAITLGGNLAPPASGAGSNYTFVIVGQGGNTINLAPVPNAGPDQSVKLMSPAIVALNGSVADDDLPNPPSLVTTQWSVLSSPVGGNVAFADSTNPVTFASFSELGVYTLTLSANDGEFITTDEIVITVIEPETLTGITLNQAAATALPGGLVQFTASGEDQFGSPFPINTTWEVSGGGFIDQSGLFTAGLVEGGPFTVTASDGTISGTGSITVAGVVAQLEVSNLAVASGQAYRVVDGLSVGSPVYIDRDYTYTNVPAIIDGVLYIQTANDDKNRTETSFLTFSVNQDVTVYVAYDSRATSLPDWLAGWVNTGQALVNTDVPLALYSKDFAAGSITLGGNNATGSVGAGSNYSVIAVVR